MRNVFKIVGIKSERKAPLGRTRHKWVENIEMN
jgi:hypothetical protein